LEVPLMKRAMITHDTFLLTFELPDPGATLGLQVGQHITVNAVLPSKDHPEGEEFRRNYTPVSKVEIKGHFELLIKVYRKNVHPKFPEGGKISQYLESLKVGDILRISGPKGILVYKGNGKVERDFDGKKVVQVFKDIGMIAGGTGVTPMFQIMKHLTDYPNDPTRLHLLFANKSEQDILLRPELEAVALDPRIKVYHTLDVAPKAGWKGFEGFVTKEMIAKAMPTPGKGTLMLQCGPPPMNKLVSDLLKELGYTENNVYKF